MPEAVIVSALRTPIGTAMKGTLRDTDAYADSVCLPLPQCGPGRPWVLIPR
jgi:hypothetical protein